MGAMANWGIPKGPHRGSLKRASAMEDILIGVTPHTAEEATEIERLWQACGATHVQPA